MCNALDFRDMAIDASFNAQDILMRCFAIYNYPVKAILAFCSPYQFCMRHDVAYIVAKHFSHPPFKDKKIEAHFTEQFFGYLLVLVFVQPAQGFFCCMFILCKE